MKKLLLRRKEWLAAKSKKEIRRRQRRNHPRRQLDNEYISKHNRHKDFTHAKDLLLRAPDVLDLFENSQETLAFFGDVNEAFRTVKVNGSVFFDLSNVSQVSVDAVMYLIATLENTKKIKIYNVRCSGNVPQYAEPRKRFESCGFYNFVLPQYTLHAPRKDDHINITRGSEANPVLAQKVCDFVHAHSDYNRLQTKSLFTMLMELMTNTKQHAYNIYNGSIKSEYNWYVYAEDTPSYMSFIFLDTGEGIPNTIRTKGLIEKVKSLLDLDDAYFIASALRGEFRSETKLPYRGKGLPEIYNRVHDKYIQEFSIISGYGRCDVLLDGQIKETRLENALTGTLLCWRLSKDIMEV